MPKDLDRVDREIVRLVSAQGRMSHEEIARRVHVSRPAVHERVKRLERDGAIRGYRAVVDWTAVDLGLCPFVSVQVDRSAGQGLGSDVRDVHSGGDGRGVSPGDRPVVRPAEGSAPPQRRRCSNCSTTSWRSKASGRSSRRSCSPRSRPFNEPDGSSGRVHVAAGRSGRDPTERRDSAAPARDAVRTDYGPVRLDRRP